MAKRTRGKDSGGRAEGWARTRTGGIHDFLCDQPDCDDATG